MNKVLAIGYNTNHNDRLIMERVIETCIGIKPTVMDVTGDVGTSGASVVITFGQEAFEAMYAGCVPYLFVGLPAPSRLLDTQENEEARQYTFEKLTEVRKKLDAPKPSVQNNSLTEESLPPIAANDVAQLAKINPNGWVGKTKNGRTIRLSARPTEEGSEDIKLTFSELYALKVATELLGVKEFTLVPSNQADTSSGS